MIAWLLSAALSAPALAQQASTPTAAVEPSTPVPAAVLSTAAAPAEAYAASVSSAMTRYRGEHGIQFTHAVGFTGGFDMFRAEVWVPVGKTYELSARVQSFQFEAVFPGAHTEYSARMKKELYHVTMLGRLGTQPPDAERAGYHLASGEARMTFYGAELGPEHPDLSPVVWEGSTTAPSPWHFDRTWVGRLMVRYTNTNHHIEGSNGVVLVQNSWQFEWRQTWMDRAGALLQNGHHRYNKDVHASTISPAEANIDYPGNVFPIIGWPNNYVGGALWAGPYRGLKATVAATRLNLIEQRVLFVYSYGLEWRPPGSGFTIGADYELRRNKGFATREAITLRLSCFW